MTNPIKDQSGFYLNHVEVLPACILESTTIIEPPYIPEVCHTTPDIWDWLPGHAIRRWRAACRRGPNNINRFIEMVLNAS